MWISIGRTVLQSLVSMGAALLTEGFLKQAIVIGLSKLAVKTSTDVDDRLLKAVRSAWGMAPDESSSTVPGTGG